MECAVDISSASALALPCLDLSKRDISELPEVKGCEHLRCLYLEGNSLSQLPASLFPSCPNLQWLDLRNNLLAHLPPSIHLLRELKTLLLQGNRLTSLPPELGELRQLSGLGLADNPLSFPPRAVVRRGTGAVLGYLRGQLQAARRAKERGETESGVKGGRDHCDVDSDAESEEECTVLPHWSLKQTTLPPKNDPHYRQRTGHWPLALMKQAHIHPHPPHSPPPHLVYSPTQRRGKGAEEKEISGERRGAGESKQKRRGGGRKRGDQGHKQERVIVHIPPLSSEEKLRANIKIEKQRSREGLEQWRAEARLDHLKPPAVESPAATDSAPYATDRSTLLPAETGGDLGPTSPLSGGQEEMVRERVERYNLTLRAQRRQAGLISDASSDLLEAERRLAEALAQRDEVEERKKREYRLTAFTADPNLL